MDSTFIKAIVVVVVVSVLFGLVPYLLLRGTDRREKGTEGDSGAHNPPAAADAGPERAKTKGHSLSAQAAPPKALHGKRR